MSNHFHVLVRVRDKTTLSDNELLERVRKLYKNTPEKIATIEYAFKRGGKDAEECRKRLQERMDDVSIFMKELKQRFSIWYNNNHGRYGTLWAERFKSLLVENKRHALATVAAYIDLNPIRAAMAEDPAAYRFCGYAEAMAMGGKECKCARDGLRYVLGSKDWSVVAREYRMILFGKGAKRKAGGGGAVIDRAKVRAVLASGGTVERTELLHCGLRHLSNGAILGSAVFVDSILKQHPEFRLKRIRKPFPLPIECEEGENGTNPPLTVYRRVRLELSG
jgi:hypothetical protein